MVKRVISTEITEEDVKIESNLRPQLLEDYIGQAKAKANLKIYIEAAKARKRLTMCYFMVRLVLGKQLLQELLQMKWE